MYITVWIVMTLFIYAKANSILQDLKVGRPNFILHNITNCSDYTPTFIFSIQPKFLNKTYQVVDGHLFAPKPIGDDHMVSVTGRFLINNSWMSTGEIPNLSFCLFLKNILGPLRNDFYASMNLNVDTCPIPAGTHAMRNFNVDFKKSRLPALPAGEYSAVFKVIEKATKSLSTCLQIFLFNQI